MFVYGVIGKILIEFRARNIVGHKFLITFFLNTSHTELTYSRVGKIGLCKSPAAPLKLKPSLHGIGSGRYLPHITETGTRVSPVPIQIDPSPL